MYLFDANDFTLSSKILEVECEPYSDMFDEKRVIIDDKKYGVFTDDIYNTREECILSIKRKLSNKIYDEKDYLAKLTQQIKSYEETLSMLTSFEKQNT
jgi:hypothetical protein